MKTGKGIDIEKYADLCARMDGMLNNRKECLKIASNEGIKPDEWEEAHKYWQERITDPEDMGRTAAVFMAFWEMAKFRLK